MYLFYDLETIKQFSIFSQFDFSTFTDFQNLVLLLGVNLFYISFLSFVFTIIYKTFNRLINILF